MCRCLQAIRIVYIYFISKSGSFAEPRQRKKPNQNIASRILTNNSPKNENSGTKMEEKKNSFYGLYKNWFKSIHRSNPYPQLKEATKTEMKKQEPRPKKKTKKSKEKRIGRVSGAVLNLPQNCHTRCCCRWRTYSPPRASHTDKFGKCESLFRRYKIRAIK